MGEDGLTQRELSQRVGMMEPTTVTALQGMVRRGLVRRVRNTKDRRKIHVYLTDEGRALREQLLPFAAEVNRMALEGCSAAEIETVRKVLGRMHETLEAHNKG